jgi:TatD DNase family protein
VTDREMAGSIVDTHAHLDDAAFDQDRDGVITEARRAGVSRIINIGYQPESWEASRRLRDQQDGIEIAIGLHPHLADNFDADLDRALTTAIRDLRPLAVGEAGFDFFRASPPVELQKRAFRRQIEIAIQENIPLIIHQREACEALAVELDRWPELASIVLHSFDGNQGLTEWAIERGCYVGIGGLATRPRFAELRDLLKRVPVERLLLETDSPFLTPPTAPTRRNSPANLPLIAGLLAPLWNITTKELCWQTSRNASSLFGFALP